MFTASYTVSAPGLFFSSTNALPFRFSSSNLGSMKVPANGATTTLPTVNVTIRNKKVVQKVT
jgi:hypothetical protein